MIKARNIIKSYQNGESRFQVLKDISLDIEDNDFVVILGASGSGKSTFLNVISGLERPDSGKVFYDGKDITMSTATHTKTPCRFHATDRYSGDMYVRRFSGRASRDGWVSGGSGRYAIPARRALGANTYAIFPTSHKEA